MSEEEKKAIEILRSFEPDDLIECSIYLQALNKVTNLIDKQQKEIKELNDTLKCTQNSWYKDTKVIETLQKEIEELQKYTKTNLIPKSTINLLYISKDKIKEKIKEIENVETDKISREEYNRIEFAIEILLELLEE